MKPRSGKNKGKRLQNEVARKISELLEIPWGPDELISSREMGQCGTDVRLIGEALKKFPFSIECKNQETWSVPGWIAQAKANTREGTDWLLIASKNRFSPVVIMDFDTLLGIYRKLLYKDTK